MLGGKLYFSHGQIVTHAEAQLLFISCSCFLLYLNTIFIFVCDEVKEPSTFQFQRSLQRKLKMFFYTNKSPQWDETLFTEACPQQCFH